MEFQIIAGTVSTTIFTLNNIPMLIKAAKTRSLSSYSYPYLIMSNLANLFHWFYVLAMPFGPIWFLHGFYSVSALLMLIWYRRYEYPKTIGQNHNSKGNLMQEPKIVTDGKVDNLFGTIDAIKKESTIAHTYHFCDVAGRFTLKNYCF